MPDPTAPDPFAILAQPPQMDPQTMALMQQTVGQPTLAPQPVQGVSRLPGVAGMISNLVHPPTQVQVNPKTKMAEARPASRLDVFENFLGNFLNSLSQGMAGSGTGPGANIRGAGIAMQAPRQLAIQNQQLANQQQLTQAQADEAQQRAGLYQKQGELAGTMVTLPNGMQVPATVAAQFLKGQGAADTNAKSKMSVEQMKAQLMLGQVSKIVPVQDGSGGVVMRALNKYGQPIGDIDGAIPPSSYMPKTSNTVEYKQLEDGSIVALPKSTTSGPVLPGSKGKTGGGAVSRSASGQVLGPDGQPLQFKGGITGTTKTMIETAPKVTELVSRTLSLINEQKNSLGPAASRWSEFMAGKVGAPNEQFTKLRTNVGLLQTLLMRMHVGARGGEQIMQHFKDLIDSSKQSPENLTTALGEIKLYADDVANSRGMMGPKNSGPKAGDVESGYRFKGGNPAIRTNWEAVK